MMTKSKGWRVATISLVGLAILVAIVLVRWPRHRTILVPSSGVLFGAYVRPAGSFATDARRKALTDLERDMGRSVAIDHHYYRWEVPFPTTEEAWDVRLGRTPMISWHGSDTAAIKSGSQDELIRRRADAIKDFHTPLFLRWGWEMDGDKNRTWVGSPARYIAAWRHIRGIFDEEGASNAVWVWCPTAQGFQDGVASSYYPGTAYVDWVCADGYNWAPNKPGTHWRTFWSIWSPFYAWARGTHKPIMIGETGVLERDPGDKARWLDETGETVRDRMPLLRAFLYFSSITTNGGITFDWRIDTSASAYEAFLRLAAMPSFSARPG